MYEMSIETYNKLMTKNITKTYRMGEENLTDKMNSELNDITGKLSIADRIDVMEDNNAFITLKDDKDNFNSHPKCRLKNPAKSELGKVSKVILDDINNAIRSTLNVNQWKNSNSVIDWLKKPRTNPTTHSCLMHQ